MKALLALLALAALLTLAAPALAGPNPFTSPAPSGRQAEPEVGTGATSVAAPVLEAILQWQSALRQGMSQAAVTMRGDPLGASFWLFMAMALAYGVVHALGPGHGKALAASYFLHRGGSARQALFFGQLTMLLHVLSATALVFGGRFLLQASASRLVDDMGALLQEISYALLLVVGLAMLAGSVRRCGRTRAGEEGRPAPDADRRSLVGLSLAAGLVPCPGAALVLIFSISLDLQAAGLAAMLAISLGMGLSLSAVALAASGCRGTMLGLMERRQGLYRLGHCGLSLAGSLAVTLMGGLFLLGSLAG